MEAGLTLKKEVSRNTSESSEFASGITTLQNFRSILEKDKEYGMGGHALKNRTLLRQKIDRENEVLLNSLREQKSTINFLKMEKEIKEIERIKKNMRMFPTIERKKMQVHNDSIISQDTVDFNR